MPVDDSTSYGWTSAGVEQGGYVERSFSLASEVTRGAIPGLYRTPPGETADRLVLLGHGGRTDKHVDYLVAVSALLAERGIASLVIDAPGHGDRALFEFTDRPDEFAEAWNGGGGTEAVVADWRTALDFAEDEFGARPTGWWGLSMGTMMGLPVCANEERVLVAVLGLMGTWGPNRHDLAELAPRLRTPLRFLVQWDDEVVPRDRCLELFTMLGSERKSLHGNPGAHSAVPLFESIASVDYLDHHLRQVS